MSDVTANGFTRIVEDDCIREPVAKRRVPLYARAAACGAGNPNRAITAWQVSAIALLDSMGALIGSLENPEND